MAPRRFKTVLKLFVSVDTLWNVIFCIFLIVATWAIIIINELYSNWLYVIIGVAVSVGCILSILQFIRDVFALFKEE